LGDPELARDPRMHDFVGPDDRVWDTVARTTELKLGTALNDAMRAIERANEPKFDTSLRTALSISTHKTDCRDTSWSRSSITSVACRSTGQASTMTCSAAGRLGYRRLGFR